MSIETAGALCAENFSVWIGKRQIVKNMDFCLEPGVVGLLGPNGSGKTTLMRAVLNLGLKRSGRLWLEKEKGEAVFLDGFSSRRLSAYLAYVPQDTVLGSSYQVYDFVVMGRTRFLDFLRNPGEDDRRAAWAALERLGIAKLGQRRLGTLSGGERKLVWLARAMAQEAAWTILDEPANGLDFGRQQEFFRSLKQASGESRMGVFASIHDPQLAFSYCDQVLLMKEGILIDSLKKSDKNFEEEFIRQAGSLYHMKGEIVSAMGGKSIVWRRETDA